MPNGFVLIIAGGANARQTVELFDPSAPTEVLTAHSMILGRIGHTATLLPNNRVLVTGGFDTYAGELSQVEGYDPATQQWQLTSSMSTARDGHSATLLPNGKVLVAGGVGSPSSRTTSELYNFVDNQWSPTGSFAFGAPRAYHTATLLADGHKVLVAGGWDDTNTPIATAQLYDIASGTWSLTGNMTTARVGHTATLLPNGKILIAGGGPSVSSELFDPATGTFSLTGYMNISHKNHTATLLPNGKVLIAGGENSTGYTASAELYDPSTGAWSVTGSMSQALAEHTATLLPDGKVAVIGGRNGPGRLGIQSGGGIYNTATGQWGGLGATGYAFRASHHAVLLPNGDVLLVGGATDDESDPRYPYASRSILGTRDLGFIADWQPIVNGRPPLFLGEKMGIGGSRFRGFSQASSGNAQDSSTSYPLVQLRSEVNDYVTWLPVDATAGWSDTNFTTTPLPTNFPLGPARVTVFVNGIPSDAHYVNTATLNAVSRKLHNGIPYEIAMPFTGQRGIECRVGGFNNSYQVVFKFNVPVNFGNASVSASYGTAALDGAPVSSPDHREVTFNLRDVTAQCKANVILQGIADATNPGNGFETFDAIIPFNVLIGDTNGNGAVNASDISQTKSRSGQIVDGATFRSDVNANGTMNASDISLVKSQSGTALP
jgi:N-acetylneuraminic acid mutarotase